jgi:hypothetical protein
MTEFQEFPKCIYLDGDPAKAYAVVMSADEEETKAAEGYAPAKTPDELSEEAQGETLEDLTTKAVALGIEVDARWKEKRLKAEIAKAS